MPSPEPIIVGDFDDPYNGDIDPGPRDDDLKTVYNKVAEFRGTVTGARVDRDGGLVVTVAVPFEDKYLAMPITDIRSVMMVFSVYKPEVDEATNADE